MTRVFVVRSKGDFIEDGQSIVGVFISKGHAIRAIVELYPKAKFNSLNNEYVCITDKGSHRYLFIEGHPLS